MVIDHGNNLREKNLIKIIALYYESLVDSYVHYSNVKASENALADALEFHGICEELMAVAQGEIEHRRDLLQIAKQEQEASEKQNAAT